MTPRTILAYNFLADRRREREMAQLLGLTALAHSGDGDSINKQIKRWEDDQ
jgi:hypothetical protein